MQPSDLTDLTPEDVVSAYRLIEELCERGHNSSVWREHFIKRLQEMFTARLATSYLMHFSLDPKNITPRLLAHAEVGTSEVWKAYMRRGDVRDNPVTPFIMERFGTDFTVARQEWLADADYYASDFWRDVARPSDMDQTLYSQVGITRPGVVDGIGICRGFGEPAFTPRDVALLRLIHQELARLWRKHDPLDVHMIPPRQRQVLEGIRRGDSRKAIAEAMCVSEHTVHSHERALFERANVSSRAELQAALARIIRPTLMP